jgi:protein-disulfide isomerase
LIERAGFFKDDVKLEARLKIPINSRDHHRGSLFAPVCLLEYGDFECPHCSVTANVIDQLTAEFGSGLCFIYRHFPLSNAHSFSQLAAVAAEAADQQSQFWSMHQMLFENSESLSLENLLELADSLNLDILRFQNDLKRTDLVERVSHDFNGGLRSGVNGTPTIYLNNFRFNGPITYNFLKRKIEDELETPGASLYS